MVAAEILQLSLQSDNNNVTSRVRTAPSLLLSALASMPLSLHSIEVVYAVLCSNASTATQVATSASGSATSSSATSSSSAKSPEQPQQLLQTSATAVPAEFLHAYLSKCMNACEAVKDISAQVRAVYLQFLLLKSCAFSIHSIFPD